MSQAGPSIRPLASGQSESSGVLDADILVVGYGPVGQTLAGLLGSAGHRVVVCERREGRYETPRAGHFDHEIMRIFQGLGIADQVAQIADPAKLYEFLDPDGEVVARLPREWDAPSGWDASYHFYQPELEDLLDDAVRALPSVEVRLESQVVDLEQHPDHVVGVLQDGSRLTARYAVGADGANSEVRRQLGIGTQDLGFRGDWLVVDVRPREGAAAIEIPHTGQVLNPERPNHMGRVDHRYYRWEFMIVDGDDPAEMVTDERIWALLRPWVSPEEGEVIRRTVYQFRSLVADDFRAGSVLLAGDAAHVMPPFLGQGMSSGIRDAATLTWMLDLVLSGKANPSLLDLYTASRRPHVLAYIQESMRVGEVVCETDPVRAAQRREDMRTTQALAPPFTPPVGAGFHADQPLAGHLAVQPMLQTVEGKVERSDDLMGNGFTLFSLARLEPAAIEAADRLADSVGLRTVVLGRDVEEHDSRLTAWLEEAGAVAVLVRPDFYVMGTAATPSGVVDLLESVPEQLSLK